MRDFVVYTFIPVIAYFASVAACIGIMVFVAAVAVDIVSDPIEIADVQ